MALSGSAQLILSCTYFVVGAAFVIDMAGEQTCSTHFGCGKEDDDPNV